MSFAWLFAIIAGAIIIVFAILAATKVINLGQYSTSAQSQAQLGVLLNPLQTSFESSSVTALSTPSETRIYNTCSTNGVFGEQTIGIAEKSVGKWPEFPPSGTSFESKYIFSGNITEGKQFLLFSKAFEFPFKVADLIYLTSASTNYCFINTPPDAEQELSKLNEQNIYLKTDQSQCPKGSVNVCFDSSAPCDVNVDTAYDRVQKEGLAPVYYYGNALMYAAIFSDPAVYECQLSRLMKRDLQLSQIYSDKSVQIAKEGCTSGTGQDLISFGNALNGFSGSESLNGLVTQQDQINTENSYSTCQLW